MSKTQSYTKKEVITQTTSVSYDIIVIGAGPSGMSATLMAINRGLRVLLIEEAVIWGNIYNVPLLEDIPILLSAKAKDNELLNAFSEQLAKHQGLVVYEKVLSLEEQNLTLKTIRTDKNIYTSRAVIIASGMRNIVPDASKYMNKFLGRGVSFSAPCDVIFFLAQRVAIVGNNEFGAKIALYLADFVQEICFIVDGSFISATEMIKEAVIKNPKIKIFFGHKITELLGDEFLQGCRVVNTKNKMDVLGVKALFVYENMSGNAEFINDKIKLNHGFIPTNENMETNMPGVYAIGSVRDAFHKRFLYCMSDALTAVNEVQNFLYFNK